MLKRLLIFGISIFIIIAIVSCSSDDNPIDSTNQPPTIPSIFPASSTPTDGATDVPLNSVLRWICSDPDGDPLTYTVYLGTSSPPLSISVSQSPASFDPDLVVDLTYYWQIAAADDDNATSVSPIWSFTTTDGIVPETVSNPSPPIGPITGQTDQLLTFTTGNSVNNFGHPLEYRFDWGSGVFSDWSSTTTMSHSWSVAATWNVRAQARCATHPTIMSEWTSSLNDLIITAPSETVSRPDQPIGPTTGEANASLDFLAGGAINSVGHSLKYRFDWGDGTFSLWSQSVGKSHSWADTGSYNVAVQARCAIDSLIESSWSESILVVITPSSVEFITTPNTPTGLATGEVGASLTYTVTGGISNFDHEVEYSFFFHDDSSSITTTYSTQTTISHSWQAAGMNSVSVRARCKIHPTILSEWSSSFIVTVEEPSGVANSNRLVNKR